MTRATTCRFCHQGGELVKGAHVACKNIETRERLRVRNNINPANYMAIGDRGQCKRCFWRAMKPQPESTGSNGGKLRGIVWNDAFSQWDAQYFGDNPRLVGPCPYGTTGDRIELTDGAVKPHPKYPKLESLGEHTITAITVTQRNGKRGWLVEVGA